MHNVNIVIDLENTEAVKFYDPEVYSIINALDEQIDFPGSKKLVPIDKAKKVNNVNEEKTYADKNIAQSIVVGGDSVIINCIEAPIDCRIRYAVNGDYMKSGNLHGPRGNLRDATNHWCYQFDILSFQ